MSAHESGLLLTGATGFVGCELAVRLGHDGWQVTSAVREEPTFPGAVFVGDIDGDTDWLPLLTDCVAVVHLAARVHVMRDVVDDSLTEFRKVNVEGTLNLARQAAAAGVSRFVFLSTAKVNGEGTAGVRQGLPFHQTRPRAGGGGSDLSHRPRREVGCFHEADAPAPQDSYALSKWEAEQGLLAISRETGMEIVIIRPPLVYGPGVKGNFAALEKWVRRGVPFPLGAVHNRRSLVALDNLVDFIALCTDRDRSPLAANQVFMISDGEDVSTVELLSKIARAYGTKARLFPVPLVWLRFAAGLFGKRAAADRLLGSLVIDSSKARSVLGWRPVVTMDEQLRKMARDAAPV